MAFYADLAAHNLSENVVVMTWSEFGRRVEENASLGTDHGTAAPLFVLGDAVHGGDLRRAARSEPARPLRQSDVHH